MSNEEELHYTLLEQTWKWEEAFNDWNLLQSKEMVNITHQVNEAKKEVTTLSQKGDLVRKEIAWLEEESLDITKKIIEAGKVEDKVMKKVWTLNNLAWVVLW